MTRHSLPWHLWMEWEALLAALLVSLLGILRHTTSRPCLPRVSDMEADPTLFLLTSLVKNRWSALA